VGCISAEILFADGDSECGARLASHMEHAHIWSIEPYGLRFFLVLVQLLINSVTGSFCSFAFWVVAIAT
jgi:hypothetical protein